MRIVCEDCGAKYVVPDDKIHKKVVRLDCQKCGATITARRDEEPAPPATGDLRARLGLSEERSVPPPRPLEPTDWYYSCDGQSFGPFAHAMLLARFSSGELGSECYVWHRSLGAWQPAHSTPPFEEVIAAREEGGAQETLMPGVLSAAVAAADASGAQPKAARAPAAHLHGLRARLDALDEDGAQRDSTTDAADSADDADDADDAESADLDTLIDPRELAGPQVGSSAGPTPVAVAPERGEDASVAADGDDEGIDLDVDGASRVIDYASLVAAHQQRERKKEALSFAAADPENAWMSEEQHRSHAELMAAVDEARDSLPENAPVERSMLIHIDHLRQQNRRVKIYAALAVLALLCLGASIGLIMYFYEADIGSPSVGVRSTSLAVLSGTAVDGSELERLAPLDDFTIADVEPEEDVATPTPGQQRPSTRSNRRAGNDPMSAIKGIDASAQLTGLNMDTPRRAGGAAEQGTAPEIKTGDGGALSATSLGSGINTRRSTVALETSDLGPGLPSRASKYAQGEGRKVSASERNTFATGLQRVSRTVQECHKRQLNAGVAMAAKIYLNLTVEPEGRVSRFAIDQSVRGTDFETCLQSKRDRWIFDPFDGAAVELRQGFVLE